MNQVKGYIHGPDGSDRYSYGGEKMEFEKVKKVIAEQMGVDEASISKDTSFVDDLGADSLDVVELVMALEEEFDMEFSDGEAENMKTIGDVVEYIKAQM